MSFHLQTSNILKTEFIIFSYQCPSLSQIFFFDFLQILTILFWANSNSLTSSFSLNLYLVTHQVLLLLSPVSHVQLCETPMDSSPPGSSVHRILQGEYWSRLPCPPLGDRLDSGIESVPLVSPALAGGFFTTSIIWEDQQWLNLFQKLKMAWLGGQKDR